MAVAFGAESRSLLWRRIAWRCRDEAHLLGACREEPRGRTKQPPPLNPPRAS